MRCNNRIDRCACEPVKCRRDELDCGSGNGDECGCPPRERRDFNCPGDHRVIKHQHVVRHRHDIVHEYDVLHVHDHHTRDVVRVREEHRHHDHRRHRPEYCEGDNCGEFNPDYPEFPDCEGSEIECV